MAKNEKLSNADLFAQAIENNRRLLVILGLIVILAITVTAVTVGVVNNRNKESILLAEEMQEIFDEFMSASEQDAAVHRARLDELFDQITSSFPRSHGAQRSFFVMGNVFHQEEQWLQAAAAFRQLGERFPRSYLAPLSFVNAGAAYEEAGETASALEMFRKIVDNYQDDSLSPRAVFNLARLTEVSGNPEEAVSLYQSLLVSYPSSDWTKLARDRIIEIGLN